MALLVGDEESEQDIAHTSLVSRPLRSLRHTPQFGNAPPHENPVSAPGSACEN
jgi:hypothetical protein